MAYRGFSLTADENGRRILILQVKDSKYTILNLKKKIHFGRV